MCLKSMALREEVLKEPVFKRGRVIKSMSLREEIVKEPVFKIGRA